MTHAFRSRALLFLGLHEGGWTGPSWLSSKQAHAAKTDCDHLVSFVENWVSAVPRTDRRQISHFDCVPPWQLPRRLRLSVRRYIPMSGPFEPLALARRGTKPPSGATGAPFANGAGTLPFCVALALRILSRGRRAQTFPSLGTGSSTRPSLATVRASRSPHSAHS